MMHGDRVMVVVCLGDNDRTSALSLSLPPDPRKNIWRLGLAGLMVVISEGGGTSRHGCRNGAERTGGWHHDDASCYMSVFPDWSRTSGLPSLRRDGYPSFK